MSTPTPDRRGHPEPRARPGFGGRTVELAAGAELDFDRADWTGALVVVASGEVELVCARGRGWRFRTGSLLVLDLPDLRVVRNSGEGTARLVAIYRAPHRTDESGAPASS